MKLNVITEIRVQGTLMLTNYSYWNESVSHHCNLLVLNEFISRQKISLSLPNWGGIKEFSEIFLFLLLLFITIHDRHIKYYISEQKRQKIMSYETKQEIFRLAHLSIKLKPQCNMKALPCVNKESFTAILDENSFCRNEQEYLQNDSTEFVLIIYCQLCKDPTRNTHAKYAAMTFCFIYLGRSGRFMRKYAIE